LYDGEFGLVGVEDAERGKAHLSAEDGFGKAVGGASASRGYLEIVVFGAVPGEFGVALCIELDWDVVGVEDFGHYGVGECFAVHLLAPATPRGVEIDEVKLGVAFAIGFGGLFDGFPFDILSLHDAGKKSSQQKGKKYFFCHILLLMFVNIVVGYIG
jgi:hypothetical protein